MRDKDTPHEANGGLDQGRPDLSHTKRVHKKLLAQGLVKQAQALEAIVVHNVWNASRERSPGQACANAQSAGATPRLSYTGTGSPWETQR